MKLPEKKDKEDLNKKNEEEDPSYLDQRDRE